MIESNESKELKIAENLETINQLLEKKNVSVMDDLIQDIFINDETDEHLFYMQKLDNESPIDLQVQITTRIIEKLTNLQ